MLSSSNTIPDVKAKLINNYETYGFSEDRNFKVFIESSANESYLDTLLPLLGESLYSTIQAKNKVDLSEIETYIYWAEVHMICAEVLNGLGEEQAQMTSGTASSFSSEGYSQSVTNPGKLGFFDVSISHWNKAKKYLAVAGYPMSNRMKRGGNFFTEDIFPSTEYLPGI